MRPFLAAALAIFSAACDPAASYTPPAGPSVNRLWVKLHNASNVSRECFVGLAWMDGDQHHAMAMPLEGQVILGDGRREAFADVPPEILVAVSASCWKGGDPERENGSALRVVGAWAPGCVVTATYNRGEDNAATMDITVANCPAAR